MRPATTHGASARCVELVAERGVERVIVGLPLSLSGGDSEQTREARAFADRLRSALARRRAGRALRRALHDGDRGARRAGGDSEDSRAAAVLLEDWLARHGHEHRGRGT